MKIDFRCPGSNAFTWILGRCLPWIIACAAVQGYLARASTDDVEARLLEQMPAIHKFLADQGYRSVGVLKFRGQRGAANLTDNLGTINRTLADRLEKALILTTKPHEQTLTIVGNASDIAANLPNATHLTAEGRAGLFKAEYPVAWGDELVTPDAFLSGVIQISDDLRQLSVGIVGFGQDAELKRVSQFTADIEPFDLIEAGESFVVRGVFGSDDGQIGKASEEALRTSYLVQRRDAQHPLLDPEAPLELAITYDDKPAAIEMRDGRAFVREPNENERVSIVLTRRPNDMGRLGIVLKVNGINTLYHQRLPDAECKKWILDPGDPPLNIRGFQRRDNQVELFRVLSAAESAPRLMNYGKDVGTISLTVFRQGLSSTPHDFLEDEDLLALRHGSLPDGRPANLAALQAQLRDTATRGLIESGTTAELAVNVVKFTPYPVPVMAATITYYRP